MTVDDRAEARKIGYAGVEAYNSGMYPLAHERLEAAYKMLRVPSLGLWSARTLARLGRLVEAEARYREVVALPTSVGDAAVQKQAQAEALTEQAEVAARIARVRLHIEGAAPGEVTVAVDGSTVAWTGEWAFDPGTHRIDAQQGTRQTREILTLTDGERREVVLRFGAVEPPRAPPPITQAPAPAETAIQATPPANGGDNTPRTLAWVSLGVGGAALVTGAVSGLVLIGKKADLDDSGCTGGACPHEQQSAVESYNLLRTITGVSLIAGTVLAGAGLYLLMTSRPATDRSAAPSTTVARPRRGLRLAILPGAALLGGEF